MYKLWDSFSVTHCNFNLFFFYFIINHKHSFSWIDFNIHSAFYIFVCVTFGSAHVLCIGRYSIYSTSVFANTISKWLLVIYSNTTTLSGTISLVGNSSQMVAPIYISKSQQSIYQPCSHQRRWTQRRRTWWDPRTERTACKSSGSRQHLVVHLDNP